MHRLPRNLALVAGVASMALAACSATSARNDFGNGGAAATASAGHTTAAATTGAGTNTGSTGSLGGFTGATTSTGAGTGGGTVCNAGMNEDKDKDGWTIAEGDCNDCDPNVNPGAVDVPATPGHPAVDDNCDGKLDPPVPCDTGLQLDDVTPMDGARAIELCQTTTMSPPLPMKTWGVLNASYVRADGSAGPGGFPGLQVGIQSNFGPHVKVQAGANMLALSCGTARLPNQPGACGSESCPNNMGVTPPPGFPQDVPNCPGASNINDDVSLELQIRAPTNATGYKYLFKFASFEYPNWVCSPYNDQYIALVNPAPMGSINGNISFDSHKNPVSVNLAFFDVCDPGNMSGFACQCASCGGTCPSPPNPYCPSGTAELQGTGFDVWGSDSCGNGTSTYGGATSWLETQAPVTGGSVFTIRFAIWNTGDQALFSTVLLDNFQWIANGGTVSIMTQQPDAGQAM